MMRLVIRGKPIIKSAAYGILCLGLLLFSCSFFPALRITDSIPHLLCAAVSLLAYFEDIKFASFFAAIFGITESIMLGTNTLTVPLFYTVYAFVCVWLFESFFVKNYLAWLCYMLGGLVVYSVLSLFGPVANWNITAADILLDTTVPTFILSAVLSLPLYPIFKFIKKKTDKER